MRVLVIGSGGREHAICGAFKKSDRASRIYCADGNAGIAEIAECVAIKPNSVNDLARFASENRIDITFVGGEGPLAAGIVDKFESVGLPIIGPTHSAARLEASKAFAKEFMHRHQIPTAAHRTAESAEEAETILRSGEFGDEMSPVVIKADGLAAGKGVVVAKNRAEAIAAVSQLGEIAGKQAAARIVIEEFLEGPEVSQLLFVDGDHYALMPPARDHKRIGEGDTGPNTGGMGTITGSELLTEDQTRRICREIIEPTLRGCREEGFPFRGVLFLGLMMAADGPKVLEYNVRFGDPETQSILIRLETDFIDICEAILQGTLQNHAIKWRGGASACVIMASAGYPLEPRTGDVITGIDAAAALPNVRVFHSSTRRDDSGHYVTSGGRVLGVTAAADDLPAALDLAYKGVSLIKWDGMQYRRDIGRTGLEIADAKNG